MAKKDIRLIAVDLDGTLMIGWNRISDGVAEALRAAVDAGVHIVLATSRWYLTAKPIADRFGITAPIICHNGAMIRTPADDARLLELDIPVDAAREIAAIADERGYETFATVDDVTFMRSSRPNVDPARLPKGMVLSDDVSSRVRDGCESFIFFGDDAVSGLPVALGGRYDEVLNLAAGYSETFPPYLNIVNAGADKGRALRIVCEHVGVPIEQSMAIGDAAPDLPMMLAAGLSMAMGNAPDEVKAQAAFVGPSNLDDGVAWAIHEFALG